VVAFVTSLESRFGVRYVVRIKNHIFSSNGLVNKHWDIKINGFYRIFTEMIKKHILKGSKDSFADSN